MKENFFPALRESLDNEMPREPAFYVDWEQETGRGDAPTSKDTWEEQYQKGGWEFMRRLDELPDHTDPLFVVDREQVLKGTLPLGDSFTLGGPRHDL